MKLYLAPMEALTGYIYRNAYHHFFDDADRYFTPFIASKKLNSKEKNDIIPEHNSGINVIPQILTNRSDEFIYIANRLKEFYGYEEVNLNLGCPSGTVVAKNRGSGFLKCLPELDKFLEEIYDGCKTKISIKTRTGVENSDEWASILEMYNKYPLSELIIHPRCQKDFYAGPIRYDDFRLATEVSTHSLCFNGDINSVEDYERIRNMFPTVGKIMCGRGILKNPGLFGEIKGKEPMDMDTLKAFMKEVYLGYKEIMSGDRNVLFKLKELWFYVAKNFDNPEKVVRKIRKAQSCAEYEVAVNNIFYQYEMD